MSIFLPSTIAEIAAKAAAPCLTNGSVRLSARMRFIEATRQTQTNQTPVQEIGIVLRVCAA
jgi:hypothetical protein